MTILFSHNTARRYWEFVGVSGRRGTVGGDSVLREASGRKSAIERCGIAGEGSRSPAETMLYLLLSVPREMFGYGLPRPLLNQRIDLAPTAQMRLRQEYLLVDLLFPDERLVVEYDSRAFHNAQAKLNRDDDRREVLQDMGYEVVVVRAERLSNFRRFDDLVRFTIGKRLGIEVPPMDPRFARGVQNLREDLALASGACS